MSYTYEKVDLELVPAGDYEVTLEVFEKRLAGANKTEKLYLQYRIRSDVEQPRKNSCLFEDIWKEKESPEHFNRKRINQLLGTQNVKDGQVFDTINDVINFMLGSNLKLHVTVEFDEYQGRNINRVAWYRSSDFKNKSIEQPKPEPKQEEVPPELKKVDLTDAEIPF